MATASEWKAHDVMEKAWLWSVTGLSFEASLKLSVLSFTMVPACPTWKVPVGVRKKAPKKVPDTR